MSGARALVIGLVVGAAALSVGCGATSGNLDASTLSDAASPDLASDMAQGGSLSASLSDPNFVIYSLARTGMTPQPSPPRGDPWLKNISTRSFDSKADDPDTSHTTAHLDVTVTDARIVLAATADAASVMGHGDIQSTAEFKSPVICFGPTKARMVQFVFACTGTTTTGGREAGASISAQANATVYCSRNAMTTGGVSTDTDWMPATGMATIAVDPMTGRACLDPNLSMSFSVSAGQDVSPGTASLMGAISLTATPIP